MKYRDWVYLGLVVFPIYVLGRASFAVPFWLDLLAGLVLGLTILPAVFFRSAAIGVGVIVLFVLAFPSLTTMEFGKLGKPGILFLFSLWVILILVIFLDRSKRR